MGRRAALTVYLAAWAALLLGVIYWLRKSGVPVWAGIVGAWLLFMLVNGTLAYKARALRLRSEGKQAPSYFRYVFFPTGAPKFKDEAPTSTHYLVGVIALVAGAFLVFCGVGLAVSAQWSRMPHPIAAMGLCLIPSSIGVALLYFAWRCFAVRSSSSRNVA